MMAGQRSNDHDSTRPRIASPHARASPCVPRCWCRSPRSAFAALIGLALIALDRRAGAATRIAAFIDGTVGSPYAIAASINRSLVFALVGFGFVLANRANLTNVGGEGQIAVGGIAATAVALYGHVAQLPLGLAFILPMLAGVLAGAVWGAIAAVHEDQGRHQRGDQHVAAVVHRGVAAVLVRAVAGAAAQADDQFGHVAGIAGNSRRDQTAAADRRLFLPAAYRASDHDRDRRGGRGAAVENRARLAAARGRPQSGGGATAPAFPTPAP